MSDAEKEDTATLHVDAQLMQYLLFLLSHPISSILILSRSAIFQQKFIQTGRERNFVDKAAPFAQLFVNPGYVSQPTVSD